MAKARRITDTRDEVMGESECPMQEEDIARLFSVLDGFSKELAEARGKLKEIHDDQRKIQECLTILKQQNLVYKTTVKVTVAVVAAGAMCAIWLLDLSNGIKALLK